MGTLAISVALQGEHVRKTGMWKAPTYIGFQAPVPAPPDYSTPAKVTARCWEAAGGRPFTHKAATDKSFGKLYRAFRAVVPAMPCPVADTHTSNVEIVPALCVLKGTDGHECRPGSYYRASECVEGLTLVPKAAPPSPKPKRTKRQSKAA